MKSVLMQKRGIFLANAILYTLFAIWNNFMYILDFRVFVPVRYCNGGQFCICWGSVSKIENSTANPPCIEIGKPISQGLYQRL